jgi:predicted DCC family thiol-disulfide oxidoreductase YuxK
MLERLRATYLRLDPRSLALGRIVLGLVLLVDLARRVPWIRDLYSNLGLIPNHTVLWRPPFPRIFSFFFMASLPEETSLWFWIAFACFFCFCIGYRTRLFHALSFLMTVSLHNRILAAENWGGVAIAVLMVWTFFLPLGRRYSVDAIRASLRARPDETPAELAAGVPPPDTRQTTSLAALALLLQIATIYFFNYIQKTGPTWRHGDAVHYVLWQERIVTVVGLWIREHLPDYVARAMTFGTLIVEGAAPILILAPIFWRWTRFLAVLLLLGLHVSIAMMVNLGIFSFAMIAFEPFLLTDAQWRLFARLVPKRGRARTVVYDADCGVCWATVRVVARMDAHRRLLWIPSADAAALPAGIDPGLFAATIVVVDPATGRQWTRADGFAEIFRALPLGGLWSWPMRLPGVRQAANWGYDLFACNRTRISAFFGLAACGVPVRPRAPRGTAAEPEVTPLRAWLRRRRPLVRELAVALTMFVLTAEVLVANWAVPTRLRIDHRPEWMVAAVMYPHLFEGWSLFAPEAPLTDGSISVDAVTRDGRHVDPFNQVASRVATLPVDDVPVRLGNNSFFCDYSLRIPDAGEYHQAFLEWLLRYPDRTGRPADEIVKLDAYVIEHDSPPPGKTHPTRQRKRLFLHWP